MLGIDVAADPVQVKQRVGYVPETHHIYRWMRVREVIGFCKSCFRSWNDQTCREMLESVRAGPGEEGQASLEGNAGRSWRCCWPSRTSRSCCCLTSRCRAWTRSPARSFLDGVLRTICDRGQTVLISSHMLDDVRRLADTVGILHEGQLLLHGNLDALLTSTKRICATLRDGCRPEQSPEGTIWQRVQGREWTVTVRDFSPEKVAAGPGDRRRGARQRGRPGAGRTFQGLHSRAKGSTMKWLLWKDYRHNRLVVFAGLFFLLAPYLVGLYAACRQRSCEAAHPDDGKRLSPAVASYSLVISQMTVALIGGNAIAGERVDRSAEFLASLPITRRKILASKLLLSLAITAAIWLTDGPLFVCWEPWPGGMRLKTFGRFLAPLRSRG